MVSQAMMGSILIMTARNTPIILLFHPVSVLTLAPCGLNGPVIAFSVMIVDILALSYPSHVIPHVMSRLIVAIQLIVVSSIKKLAIAAVVRQFIKHRAQRVVLVLESARVVSADQILALVFLAIQTHHVRAGIVKEVSV